MCGNTFVALLLKQASLEGGFTSHRQLPLALTRQSDTHKRATHQPGLATPADNPASDLVELGLSRLYTSRRTFHRGRIGAVVDHIAASAGDTPRTQLRGFGGISERTSRRINSWETHWFVAQISEDAWPCNQQSLIRRTRGNKPSPSPTRYKTKTRRKGLFSGANRHESLISSSALKSQTPPWHRH